ncbi:MAG: hypothetical protein RI922_44 [Bacteroidota bacterium]|jgi:hypothetical protein
MEVLSFQEALNKANIYTKKHLLLGNGFSIACVPTIFSYNSLFAQADFSDMPEVEQAFKKLNTTDFEVVIKVLEFGSEIFPIYKPEVQDVIELMKSHAHKLKERLIETIAKNHPANPSEIEEKKLIACRSFLANFIQVGGYVFYLNYDLLLYWTLMNSLDKSDEVLKCNDGFGRDAYVSGDHVEYSDYLSWQGKSSGQNVHYLHGAIHLFDTSGHLEKFSWVDSGVPLLQQAKKALNEGKFPLFVSEGDTEKKLHRINRVPYLHYAYDSFKGVLGSVRNRTAGNTCIFTFGFSFSENDRHIYNEIATGRIKHIFVGLYGNPASKENQRIITTVLSLKSLRESHPLEVTFYDAESANIWGNT